MKKTATFLVLFLVCNTLLFSQHVNLERLQQLKEQLETHIDYPTPQQLPSERSNTVIVPPVTIDFSGNKIMSTATRTMTIGNQPAEWTFNGQPQLLLEIANSFKDQLPNPSDTAASRKFLADNKVMEFIKFQGRWENNALSPNYFWWDSLMQMREHDVIGAIYSQQSTQCGNFARLAANILIATGYFTESDFRFVSFLGSQSQNVTGHSLVEINIDGYFSMYDFDPDEPGTTFPYAGSPNGLGSAWDVHNNPSIAVRAYYNGQPWLPKKSESDYQQIFIVDIPHYSTTTYFLLGTGERGVFKLPANTVVVEHEKDPVAFVDMKDTTGYASTVARYNSYVTEMQAGHANYFDSIRVLFQVMLNNAPLEWVDSVMNRGKILQYNSLLDNGKVLIPVYHRDNIPTWKITTSDSGIISAPLVVLSVDNATAFRDSTGPFNIPLWHPETSLLCDYHYWNFCHATVTPQTHITCAVNAHIIGPTNEWSLNMIAGTATVTTQIDWVETPTGITETIDSQNFELYPNPSNGQVYVSENAELFDVTGSLITTLTKGWNSLTISKGMYFAKTGTQTRKFIVQ